MSIAADTRSDLKQAARRATTQAAIAGADETPEAVELGRCFRLAIAPANEPAAIYSIVLGINKCQKKRVKYTE